MVANPFHTCRFGRTVVHEIFFSEPHRAAAAADEYQVRYLVLPDLAATGYAAIYHNNAIPLPETLFHKLYVLQDERCGWRLAFQCDTIQVWERDVTF